MLIWQFRKKNLCYISLKGNIFAKQQISEKALKGSFLKGSFSKLKSLFKPTENFKVRSYFKIHYKL